MSAPEATTAAKPGVGAPHYGLLPLVLVVITGLIYPLVFSFAKLAADAGTPPLGFVFWHLTLSGLGLGIIAIIRRELPRWTYAHVRSYVALGFLGIVGPISLLTFLTSKLPAGLVSLVVVLSPLLTYLFAMMFRLDRLRTLSMVGIMTGLAGVLLVTVPKVSLPTPDLVGWLLLAFLAPVFFGMTNVTASLLRPPAASSVAMATGMVATTVVMMAILALATGQAYALPGPWPALPVTIGTAVVNAAFYVAFFEIVRMAGPVFFAQFNYLVVLAGFGWGALFFGETHSAYVWGAAVLMLIGLALHTWGINRAARETR